LLRFWWHLLLKANGRAVNEHTGYQGYLSLNILYLAKVPFYLDKEVIKSCIKDIHKRAKYGVADDFDDEIRNNLCHGKPEALLFKFESPSGEPQWREALYE